MIPISDDYIEVEKCVYKLYYGNRYVIVKGKTLAGSLYLIEKGYANFISSWGGVEGKESDGVNDYYKKFYTYIYKNPKLPFRIDLLLESNDGYDLLLTEQNEISKSISDKKCLNNNVEAYIPIFREKTQSYGWITKGEVERFKDFLNMPL